MSAGKPEIGSDLLNGATLTKGNMGKYGETSCRDNSAALFTMSLFSEAPGAVAIGIYYHLPTPL